MTDKNEKHHNNNNDEETVIEEEEAAHADETDLEDIEEHASTKLKSLREKLKACQEEKRKHLEDAQRAKADFLNARTRLEEEKRLDRERARLEHIETLLPLCDSFDMAMADTDAWNEAPEKWRKGFEGIFTQLRSILTAYGVSIIDPTGQPFDPNLHEAVGNEPVADESKHDQITRTVQKGYVLESGGTPRLIRPARVIVGSKE